MELKSFQKLFQMTKVINSQFEMSEILQVFVDAIAGEITQADLVGFFLKQPDGTFQGYKGNKLPVDITELLIDPRRVSLSGIFYATKLATISRIRVLI